MNVRVTKFDRDFETNSVVVGFYVQHPNYDTGIFVDFLVPMGGTDAEMTSAAWTGLGPRIATWIAEINAKRTGGLVGTTFTAPVPVVVAEETV